MLIRIASYEKNRLGGEALLDVVQLRPEHNRHADVADHQIRWAFKVIHQLAFAVPNEDGFKNAMIQDVYKILHMKYLYAYIYVFNL